MKEPLFSLTKQLQVVRPLIVSEILKQCKLILKLILQILSDISQRMYLSLFFLELIFLPKFPCYSKKYVLKILKFYNGTTKCC